MNSDALGLLFLLLLTGGPGIPLTLPAQSQPEAIVIARELISEHEGLRLRLYQDSVGKTSIGYGRNIQDNGISKTEAAVLRESDLATAYRTARALVRRFDELNTARQAVLIDLAYNLGRPKMAQFKKMLAALERLDYAVAAAEMRDSRWYGQVKSRGKHLARIMETGVLD